MRRLLVVNVLLGIPGIIYYWMLSLMVLSDPLTTWGREAKDFYEAHSLLPVEVVLGPPLAIGTMIWVLSNVNLIYRWKQTGARKRTSGKFLHWAVALVASMIPTAAFLALAALF
ncbi:hypothetical protein OF385_12195 [Glutamicibacter sp. JL.03c]|uniref:hypothetical protein n=1 Tax=Glutamicibacter sp. JL.03c TaxID=2984842 RepID=UPI0021F7F72F|nr:hypothetical protein [Glutamicibacter sp. JL.03c]UYQ76776.1 hypothetical protein OF385_12195 [Glutamicibacter sp. JL.03c]